jgi:subtilisin family serine protease
MMSKPVKRNLCFAVAISLAFLLTASSSLGMIYPDREQPKPFLIKGRVAIQLEDDIDPVQLNAGFGTVSFGAATLDRILEARSIEAARKIFPLRKEKPPVNSGIPDLTRFYELSFPDTIDVYEVVRALLENPHIRHAEPVWAMPLYDVTPNDPDWADQWHVDRINLRAAWELETGSDSVVLAMIDSGVNYDHPDLMQNIWVNPGEDLDGDMAVFDEDDLNDTDDDGNSYEDDLVGYDFFNGFGQPVWEGEDGGTPDPDPNDFDGHGTICSGVAAAATNNATGVTGLAGGWYGGIPAMSRGARIMCLRAGALAEDGIGYVNPNDCATAMDYAVNMGADVINCSWGGSSAQLFALTTALASGITVVHAAGNESCDCPDYLDGAAGGEVISVAATKSDDRKAWFFG